MVGTIDDVGVGRVHADVGEVAGRASTRGSLFTRVQLSPASSERKHARACGPRRWRRAATGGWARCRCRCGPSRSASHGGQAVGERPPRGAAVGGLEEAAARAAESRRSPTAPAAPPTATAYTTSGFDGIEQHVDAAGVLVLVEHLLERLAAVGRAEDAALVVRPVGMAEHGDEQPVGVPRVDHDLRDLLAVAQAEMRPGLAGVGRLVDAVAGRRGRGAAGPRRCPRR